MLKLWQIADEMGAKYDGDGSIEYRVDCRQQLAGSRWTALRVAATLRLPVDAQGYGGDAADCVVNVVGIDGAVDADGAITADGTDGADSAVNR